MKLSHQKHLPPCYAAGVIDEGIRLLDEAQQEFYYSLSLGDRGGILSSLSQILGLYALPHRFSPPQAVQILTVLYDLSLSNPPDIILSLKSSAVFWVILRAHSPPTQPQVLPGLEFDWRKLARGLTNIYLLSGTNLAVGSQNVEKYGNQLVMLARGCRRYWSPTACDEILAEYIPKLSIHHSGVFWSQAMLCVLLPPRSSPTWLPYVIDHWLRLPNAYQWDEAWLYLVARGSKHCTPPAAAISRLFQQFMSVMDVSLVGSNIQRAPRHDTIREVSVVFGEEFLQVDSNVAKTIGNWIGRVPLVSQSLDRMMHYLASSFHPSNDGDWSGLLAVFLTKTCVYVAQRIGDGDASIDVDAFIDAVELNVKQSLMSKISDVVSLATRALKCLIILRPQRIFAWLLPLVFESLETLTDTHKTLAALQALAVAFDIFISVDDGALAREHLPQLLTSILPGIDPNDQPKTFSTFSFILTVASWVPLRYPPLFADFIVLFLDRIFTLLSSSAHTDDDPIGSTELSFYTTTITQVMMQLSPSLLIVVIDKVLDRVTSQIPEGALDQFAALCGAIADADPTMVLARFFPPFYSRLIKNNNRTLRRCSEDFIAQSLMILSHIVYSAGEALLPYGEQLMYILDATLLHSNKKVVQSAVSLYRSSLRSLGEIYLLHCGRSLPQDIWETMSDDEFPTISTIYPQEMSVVWFSPTERTIPFFVKLIQHYFLNGALQRLEQVPSTASKDEIRRDLSLVRASLQSSFTLMPLTEPSQTELTHTKRSIKAYRRYSTNFDRPCLDGKETLALAELAGLRSRIGNVLLNFSHYMQNHRSDDAETLIALIATISCILSSSNSIEGENSSTSVILIMMKDAWANPLQRNKQPGRHRMKPRLLYMSAIAKRHYHRRNFNTLRQPFYLYHRQLIEQCLIPLCLGSYSQSRKAAQIALSGIMTDMHYCSRFVFQPILQLLSDPAATKDQLNGAIYTLLTPSLLSLGGAALRSWPKLTRFIRALIDTHIHTEDIRVQNRIFGMFLHAVTRFHHLPLTRQGDRERLLESARRSDVINKLELNVSPEHLEMTLADCQRKEQINHNLYHETLEFLCTTFTTKQLHWRFQIKVLTCILVMLRHDAPIPRNFTGVLSLSIKALTSPLPAIRPLALQLVCTVLELISDRTRPLSHTSYRFWDICPPASLSSSLELLSAPHCLLDDDQDCDPLPLISPSQFWSNHRQPEDRAELQKYIEPFFQLILNDFIQITDLQAHDHQSDVPAESTDEASTQVGSEIVSLLVPLPADWPTVLCPLLGKWGGFRGRLASFWWGIVDNLPMIDNQPHPLLARMLERSQSFASSKEKDEVLLAAELVGGMWQGCRRWNNAEHQYQLRTTIVHDILSVAWANATAETADGWADALRYMLSDGDPSEFPQLYEIITAPPLQRDTISHSALHPTKKLIWIESLFAELICLPISFRLGDAMVTHLQEFCDHPYKKVRRRIGRAIAIIFYNRYHPPSSDQIPPTSPTFTDAIDFIVNKINQLDQQSATIALSNARETLIHFVIESYNLGLAAVPYIRSLIGPILEAQKDPDPQVIAASDSALSTLAQTELPIPLLDPVFQLLKSYAQNPSWRVRLATLPLIRVLCLNHIFLLSPELTEQLEKLTSEQLADPQLEVREYAMSCFSALVRFAPPERRQAWIKHFSSRAQTPLSRSSSSAQADQAALRLRRRHAGVLGLAALMESSPYEIPEWLPSVIVQVAKHSNDPVPIRSSVETVFAEFWRTHSDRWNQEFQYLFNATELEIISELIVSPDYYA